MYFILSQQKLNFFVLMNMKNRNTIGTALKYFKMPDSANNSSSGLTINNAISAAKGFKAKNMTTAGSNKNASL
jgi:hypothetical protein